MTRINLPLYGQLKEHISYSELRLFDECQWKWFLTKVVGTPTDDRSFHMDYGKAVHAGMELLYSPAGGDPAAAAALALDFYDKALTQYGLLGIPALHPSDLKEALRIRELLPAIYRDSLACPDLQGIRPLRSELQLMVPVERTDGLSIKFKGFIDIIYIKELVRKTVIYIADFKTCQWGWPAEKFQDVTVISQILLYKHFFCKLMGADPKNVSVAFILLKKKPRRTSAKGVVPETFDLSVQVAKVGGGPKATQHALDFMQRSITGMHSYSYEQNFNACKRIWTDPDTKEERSAACPYYATEACPGSASSASVEAAGVRSPDDRPVAS